ncbi:hypothetical protein MPSEU_001048400 [Mayamaea pseudoterrestris]|nr:hypothetical protein MPSEU_001048400 [Mayamaea pseudoterrestris]
MSSGGHSNSLNNAVAMVHFQVTDSPTMTMHLSPTPIIRAPRIPLELQRVFLASNRGETVNVPPKNAFQVFPRNKSKSIGMRKVKSCELFTLLDSSSSEYDDLSVCEERKRPRRNRRMLKFAEGEATLEYDQRKPTNRCHNIKFVPKQVDAIPISPLRTKDGPEWSDSDASPALKPSLYLPKVDASRWNNVCNEFFPHSSLPVQRHVRRSSMDCAPHFPIRRKSETRVHPIPRRSSMDSVPKLPRRSGAELCMAN